MMITKVESIMTDWRRGQSLQRGGGLLTQGGAEVTRKRVKGAGHAVTIYRREGREIASELMVCNLRQNLNLL